MIQNFVRRCVLGLTGALSIGLTLSAAAKAQEPPHSSGAFSSITVEGSGSVQVTPDIARLTLGIQTTAAKPAAATKANAEKANAIVKAIKSLGIAEKDIETTDFSVSADYDYDHQTAGRPPRLIGFKVSNLFRVTVRKIGTVGAVIDAAVQSGANVTENAAFDLNEDDTRKAHDEALSRAVADAERKAVVIARAAKAGRIELFSVTEGAVPVRTDFAEDTGLVRFRAKTPISIGQKSISASVSVRFVFNANMSPSTGNPPYTP